MDYNKLIERLYQHDKDYGEGRTQDFFRVCLDCKDAATALSTLQAENEKLRAEKVKVIANDELIDELQAIQSDLARVTAERDAAIQELNGVSSLVDDLAEFVDREIHPVVDYNLYLDLRENVDAVSMFQHEDEWRGLHKEE